MFKATKAAVFKIEVGTTGSSTRITYEVGFLDDAGVVHGLMKHDVNFETSPEIGAAATGLVRALNNHATQLHFVGAPTEVLVPASNGGLSELLGPSAVSDESDEPA